MTQAGIHGRSLDQCPTEANGNSVAVWCKIHARNKKRRVLMIILIKFKDWIYLLLFVKVIYMYTHICRHIDGSQKALAYIEIRFLLSQLEDWLDLEAHCH